MRLDFEGSGLGLIPFLLGGDYDYSIYLLVPIIKNLKHFLLLKLFV